MKKYLMIFAAMMSVTMSSCTKEQTVDNDPATDPEVPAAGNKSSFTFLKVDQSRIITPKIDVQSYAAVTRASLPAGAADLEQAKAAAANAADFKTIVSNGTATPKEGGVYVLNETYTDGFDCNSKPHFTLYINGSAELKPSWINGSSTGMLDNATIYIMPNASYSLGNATDIYYTSTIHCWGKLIFNQQLSVYGKLYIYDCEEGENTPFEVNSPSWGGAALTIGESGERANPEFYCGREAYIHGPLTLNAGPIRFDNETHVESYVMIGPHAPQVEFGGCTYIVGNFSNQAMGQNPGDKSAVVTIKNYLECGGIAGENRGGTLTFNLEVATLVFKDPSTVPSNALIGNLYNNGNHINNECVKIVGTKNSQYYSAVYFGEPGKLATVYVYPDKGLRDLGGYTIDENGFFTNLYLPMFEGSLNVIGIIDAGIGVGVPHGQVTSVNHIDRRTNQEDLWINEDTSEIPVRDNCEIENGGGVITPPDEPEPTPATTKHKYSATGIDYDPTTGYMYICWHSNIAGEGEMQDEGQHDHGTNVDPDNDDDDYAGPSVEGKDDWGGIIDILDLKNNTYDPATWIFSTTAIQHEHKYNHVKFHKSKKDNKTRLYLASTSSKVGAALHVVPVNGLDIDIDVEEYRVNLVGGSANCVEVVPDVEGDEHLATISGRTVGGVNWFYIDEDANQTKYYVNKDDTKNFGGKYVCYYNNEVVTLNNTSNATVTVYTIEAGTGKLKEKRRFSTGVKLAPYDGKNAMVVKNDKVYICCGSNGLHVFGYSGTEVGKFTNFGANCVDVDNDGYIYVATGEGLAVFNPNPDAQKKYVLNKYVHYTGTGFAFNENTSGEKLPEGTVKSSSNFVRVIGDNAYVAYGMFGLRIYPLKELRPM